MMRKSVLFIAALMVSGCAGASPVRTQGAPVGGQAPSEPDPAAPSAPPPERPVNPHVVVTMPPGWTPVDMSRVPRGSFAASVNDELGARILITQGRIVGSAKEEAAALAEMLHRDGFACAPPLESAGGSVAAFTVRKAGMRGKIAVRHFGNKTTRIVVLGQWPTDEEADVGGSKAVDAVVAGAEYK